MLDQVKALAGKSDFPCNVKVDEKHFLPEWDANRLDQSCMGGFLLLCRKNRIVCS